MTDNSDWEIEEMPDADGAEDPSLRPPTIQFLPRDQKSVQAPILIGVVAILVIILIPEGGHGWSGFIDGIVLSCLGVT